MLKQTEQGKDWMEYLAVEPEVPADLLKKILARTSGGPKRESRRRHSLCPRAPPGIAWCSPRFAMSWSQG